MTRTDKPPAQFVDEQGNLLTFEELETRYILYLAKHTGGNATRIAEIYGVTVRGLRNITRRKNLRDKLEEIRRRRKEQELEQGASRRWEGYHVS